MEYLPRYTEEAFKLVSLMHGRFGKRDLWEKLNNPLSIGQFCKEKLDYYGKASCEIAVVCAVTVKLVDKLVSEDFFKEQESVEEMERNLSAYFASLPEEEIKAAFEEAGMVKNYIMAELLIRTDYVPQKYILPKEIHKMLQKEFERLNPGCRLFIAPQIFAAGESTWCYDKILNAADKYFQTGSGSEIIDLCGRLQHPEKELALPVVFDMGIVDSPYVKINIPNISLNVPARALEKALASIWLEQFKLQGLFTAYGYSTEKLECRLLDEESTN